MTQHPIIVGLGHRRDVGKDTAAELLRKLIPSEITVERRAFADALKDDCERIFAYAGHATRKHYDLAREDREVVLPALGKTPRELWIEYGNKMRAIDPAIWINRCLFEARAQIVVISDVRYPNEVDAIHANGGYVVRIDNPRAKKHHDEADTALAKCNDWDANFKNGGTIEEFMAALAPFANWLTGKVRGTSEK